MVPASAAARGFLPNYCAGGNEFGDLVGIVGFRRKHAEWRNRLTFASHLEANVLRHIVSPRHRLEISAGRMFTECSTATEDNGSSAFFHIGLELANAVRSNDFVHRSAKDDHVIVTPLLLSGWNL
jgi:hypothetical protein